jgi:hypothetical protein
VSVPPAERELGDGDTVKVWQQIYDVVVKPVDMNTVWGHGMCARHGELPPSRGGFATQTPLAASGRVLPLPRQPGVPTAPAA